MSASFTRYCCRMPRVPTEGEKVTEATGPALPPKTSNVSPSTQRGTPLYQYRPTVKCRQRTQYERRASPAAGHIADMSWRPLRLIRASLCSTPPLYRVSLFFKVQGPTPPSQRVGWTFRKVQGPTPPSQRVGWTFGKVQGPTPPRGSKRPSKSAESGRKMSFSRDLQVILKGIQRGWRVSWTF